MDKIRENDKYLQHLDGKDIYQTECQQNYDEIYDFLNGSNQFLVEKYNVGLLDHIHQK